MTLQNNTQTHLNPGIFPYCSTSCFQGQPGSYTCRIHVNKGNILFCHTAYNIEANCWSDKPEGDEKERIPIHEGETKELNFTRKQHDGEPDYIWIANNSYLKPADFTCSYEKQ